MLSRSLRPFRQRNKILKLIYKTSYFHRHTLLKTNAANLSKFNRKIIKIKQWCNYTISVLGFLGLLHPAYSKWLLIINSSLSTLADKLTECCLNTRIAEFREIAISCIPPKGKTACAEQALYEISQIMLKQNLPEPAQEILREVALSLRAQAMVEHSVELRDLSSKVTKHPLICNNRDNAYAQQYFTGRVFSYNKRGTSFEFSSKISRAYRLGT